MEMQGEAIDLQNAGVVCDLFDRAAAANFATPGRRGSVVDLPATGHVLLTGDLHDHTGNFEAILKLAQLDRAADRHLVLHELIHGEHLIRGMDFSYRILARVAELKNKYPAQLHHVLSNHELAQVSGEDIMKDGRGVVTAFNDGLDYIFGGACDRVHEAIKRYVCSLPLAVRGAGVLCAHSLPSPRKRVGFDPTVLDRALTPADLSRTGGSAHLMVWGRNLNQPLASELASLWGVDQFVLGHQPAEMGWDTCGDTMLILNSDHEHGVALELDLSRRYTRDELCQNILPLNAVL